MYSLYICNCKKPKSHSLSRLNKLFIGPIFRGHDFIALKLWYIILHEVSIFYAHGYISALVLESIVMEFNSAQKQLIKHYFAPSWRLPGASYYNETSIFTRLRAEYSLCCCFVYSNRSTIINNYALHFQRHKTIISVKHLSAHIAYPQAHDSESTTKLPLANPLSTNRLFRGTRIDRMHLIWWSLD